VRNIGLKDRHPFIYQLHLLFGDCMRSYSLVSLMVKTIVEVRLCLSDFAVYYYWHLHVCLGELLSVFEQSVSVALTVFSTIFLAFFLRVELFLEELVD
jgi:hypothetical protein